MEFADSARRCEMQLCPIAFDVVTTQNVVCERLVLAHHHRYHSHKGTIGGVIPTDDIAENTPSVIDTLKV
jgi:hypothetical protein